MAEGEANPKTDEARFFVALKRRTVRGYYTSRLGIHDELNYKGNTMQEEYRGSTSAATMRSCRHCTDWSASGLATTRLMLHSDDPIAIAITLMPSVPSAPKTRPATPGVRLIAPPTTVTMTTGSRLQMSSMSRRASS